MPALVTTVQPALEPVKLYEIKKHLNVYFDDDDALIVDYMRAARRVIELKYRRALMQQTLRMTLDGFYQPNAMPASWFPNLGNWMGVWGSVGVWGSGLSTNWLILELMPPATSVTAVSYLDPSGNTQTLNAGTDYGTDLDSEPARLFPAISKIWPATAAIPASVTITFIAGASDPNLVPDEFKHAVKLMVSHFYENRSQVEVAVGHLAKAIDLPRGVDDLLKPYWIPNQR